ncbi:MBL fold metallo-hydrolase [Alkalihalobacillus sp. MEB130]|uniref:MBL fold metallo-hydrolase n=1 Tax=Alkalihalobacillus sp. MEB130 TaxID=2976704 RepID=UPI0028E00937|nr:MBL fold metallo-hydrolase [Alkalihalobacillus sp. MEB130]MDT8860945.1 MBL fold metallo-hydrolase [Alkalihalobacillus sp. MEB130]
MTVCAETIHQLTIPTPFLVGPVHVYLICGKSLTLFDTGPLTGEGRKELIKQLNQLGYEVEDIDQVILSHHHPDHIGLASLFKHATMIGHRYLKPWIEKDQQFFRKYEQYLRQLYIENGLPIELLSKIEKSSAAYINYIEATELDIVVKHGDEVPGLPGWKVIEVPGHSQNHIMIIREQDQIAIGADVLLATISSNALLEAPMTGEERPRTLLQYRDSLRLVKSLKVKLLMTGHGDMVHNVDQLVDQRLRGHLERAKAIKELISSEKMTAHEISYRLFKEKHRKQPDLTFSETFGHLDLLLESGQIEVLKEGSFFYFKNE